MIVKPKNNKTMKVTKWNATPKVLLNDWMSEFFKDEFQNSTRFNPSVNIKETDQSFELELLAPGMKKENFHIEMEDNLLKLKAEKKHSEEEKEEGKYLRREFAHSTFEKSFTLPENISVDDIRANYEDGILKVSLPKLEETLPVKKRIEVA